MLKKAAILSLALGVGVVLTPMISSADIKQPLLKAQTFSLAGTNNDAADSSNNNSVSSDSDDDNTITNDNDNDSDDTLSSDTSE